MRATPGLIKFVTWTAHKECAILCTVAPAVRQLHVEGGNERDFTQNSDSWLGMITLISVKLAFMKQL
jgi:hypothetical protein